MLKRFSAVLIVLLIFCISLGLTACSDSVFKDDNSKAFFGHLCRLGGSQDKIKVESVSAYYHDYKCYYNAKYEIFLDSSNEWEKHDTIFVFAGTEYDASFSDENGPVYFSKTYEKYLTAKDKGKKKVFSQKEIDNFINDYFSNK